MEASIPVRFVYDYVDPGSYLASEILLRWLEGEVRNAPDPTWHPLELRTPTDAPLDPGDPGWAALTRAMKAEADREGIPLEPPARLPWTRKAHELGLHAREKGCFRAVHRALFRAHFVEGRDIGRGDVLVEVAGEQGLEAAETRTVLGVDRFLEAVEAARREALERDFRGVPILEGGGRRLEGIRSGKDVRAFLAGLEEGGGR